MAAPRHTPENPTHRPRTYSSPAHVPQRWRADRPGEIVGRQPSGPRLGVPGPDQGYALRLVARVRHRIRTQSGESVDDAIRGSIGLAMRRAATFGRAPVMDDVLCALTIWGWLLDEIPAELAGRRLELFAGIGAGSHHYAEARAIVDSIPEQTMHMTLAQLTAAMPGSWRAVTGTP